MNKSELRRSMRQLNRSLPPGARAAASERVFRHVEALPAFAGAGTVALYCALDDEPETASVLSRWAETKRLVLPRVEGDTMRFYFYDSAPLRPGAFGIEEPGAGARVCDPEEIDLICVPGVAFTAAGERLGRGRGYYDRYLAQAKMRALRVGVCFRHQVVEELPSEPHDERMDRVISDDPDRSLPL